MPFLQLGGWLVAALPAAVLAVETTDSAPAPDLVLRPPKPGALAAPGGTPAVEDAPWGFYRDRQGRVMQVSFDLGRRVWLGVGYAPRRQPTGATEIAPAAFDFGGAWDQLSPDGRTRHRYRVLDGQARLHPFGLDVTAFRYDLSHHYEQPLVRVTTFVGDPERHDLFLNIGLYTEIFRFQVAPRGIEGEHELTLGTVQGTLDFWQSRDLRSYVRLRVGPGAVMHIGPWGEQTSVVGLFPQANFEGNVIMGKRALQQLSFRLRGDFLRSLTFRPRDLTGDWLAEGEAAYEVILMAINDQPVSLRLAGHAAVRDDARGPLAQPDGSMMAASFAGWEWSGTAGIRVSFFSPPVAPAVQR